MRNNLDLPRFNDLSSPDKWKSELREFDITFSGIIDDPVMELKHANTQLYALDTLLLMERNPRLREQYNSERDILLSNIIRLKEKIYGSAISCP